MKLRPGDILIRKVPGSTHWEAIEVALTGATSKGDWLIDSEVVEAGGSPAEALRKLNIARYWRDRESILTAMKKQGVPWWKRLIA